VNDTHVALSDRRPDVLVSSGSSGIGAISSSPRRCPTRKRDMTGRSCQVFLEYQRVTE
jgi:hypothetical protein